MARRVSPATSLETLRKEAKRWLRASRANDNAARERLARMHPAAPATPVLRDVQHALAREHGYESWAALTQAVTHVPDVPAGVEEGLLRPEEYERVAGDLVLAFNSRDERALGRLNERHGTSFTFDDLGALVWRAVYAFRERASRGDGRYLLLDEARAIVARNAGYASWEALTGSGGVRVARVPPFVVDEKENSIEPRRLMSHQEWDELIAVMTERGITRLNGAGQITDALLERVAALDHVTALGLSGVRQVTDEGLQHLARMPQLEHLSLNEYPGGRLTDRGLAVLRHLPNLRTFEMTWQRGITDAGLRHLASCERIEQVDVMGTPTGDGLIEAMQGKPRLRRLATGRLVSDAGLALLPNVPLLRRHRPAQTSDGRRPGASLLVDGPFTSRGFARVAALDGLEDLDLFWHVTNLTSDALAALTALPHLESLGADGRLSDDEAMVHIGAIPRLRRLRAQESASTDRGFEALGRSATLEGFWGRNSSGFGSRALIAFSRMPALRSLGVRLDRVDDDTLARLRTFPALRELTPIALEDHGFRHVGRCERLERLTCMYCRETTDEATRHVAGLRLTYYYAGLTRITDRSLEILGRMTSLEQVELYECKGVTDAGLPFLASLPRLREVALDSLPGVTLEGTRVFPAGVRVRHTT